MLQTAFNGLVTGVIMTLPALAVTLLFGVLKFPNFAIGAMMTVAAYMAFALNAQLGWPLAASHLRRRGRVRRDLHRHRRAHLQAAARARRRSR